jgi:hypothetical protein
LTVCPSYKAQISLANKRHNFLDEKLLLELILKGSAAIKKLVQKTFKNERNVN